VLVLIIGLAAFVAAVFLAGEVVTLPLRERGSSVRRASTYGDRRGVPGPGSEPLRERALMPLKEKFARGVLRLNPKVTVEKVSARLLSAGLARRVSPMGFLSAKGMLGLSGLIFGVLLGSGSGSMSLFLGPMFGAVGFILPDMFVSQRTKKRREALRAKLPDALDLLAVSVEAGLGFDAAIAKVTEQMDGPLAKEFSLTLSEIRIGESRSVALKKLADRVAAPELAAFTRAIIQADQFGISLGRILRVQATDTRLRRQSAAEERAMKAPIKMLFPTVSFIFPAMFLVTLGPAFLSLKKVL
jgi:tight adherence protein C